MFNVASSEFQIAMEFAYVLMAEENKSQISCSRAGTSFSQEKQVQNSLSHYIICLQLLAKLLTLFGIRMATIADLPAKMNQPVSMNMKHVASQH